MMLNAEQSPIENTPRRNVSGIGDYAIIGDCRSAALISNKGSLDWLCWPRFDSPSIFAAILDEEHGGSWKIAPVSPSVTSRRYHPRTNVLETRFETSEGVVVLTDFMPLFDEGYSATHLSPDQQLCRIIRCEVGEVTISVNFAPRPNFAQSIVKMCDKGILGLRTDNGNGMLALHSNVKFKIENGRAEASLVVKAGDELSFVMTHSRASPEILPVLSDTSQMLSRTIHWWQSWASSFSYDGPKPEMVLRSALTLKLLEFPASGAIVAAPTTSLPEKIQGKLNWDYRFCWLRDAAFTIESLCGTGFIPEAEAFVEWLLHATRLTQPKLLVMYNLYGNKAPAEKVLPNLSGHKNSPPVTVGNGARGQTQLDTYGEVISGVATLLTCTKNAADRETSRRLIHLGNYVCRHWKERDAGIWESRSEATYHTHSRVACWVALDKLLLLGEKELITGVPIKKFQMVRDEIRQCIESESWNAEISSYVSEPGSCKLDASLLRMVNQNFAKADNERMRSTYETIQKSLGAGRGLLYRNLPENGVSREGAFGICGFWSVEYLAMGGGSLAEAEALFETLAATANDIGLMSEETDPVSLECLGNFPQAFTHVGFINAGLEIKKRRNLEDK